jgi:hypothetical protein
MKKVTIIFRAVVFWQVLLCAGFFSGCAREAPLAGLDMPTTPVLAIRANWGLVVSAYLRVRSKPESKAEVVAHLRNSSIVEILAKTSYPETVEGKSDYWYEIACDGIRGWVFGSYLEFHDSRQEAEKAAEKIIPSPSA